MTGLGNEAGREHFGKLLLRRISVNYVGGICVCLPFAREEKQEQKNKQTLQKRKKSNPSKRSGSQAEDPNPIILKAIPWREGRQIHDPTSIHPPQLLRSPPL